MKNINRFIENITASLIIAISIIGSANAIFRYVGKYLHISLSSNFFIELQWFLYSVIFLLGASVTFIKDKHIRVDVFFTKYSKKKKRFIDLFGTLLFLIPFCVIIIYFSWTYFMSSVSMHEQSTDPHGIPRYIIKFFIPLGFSLLLINALQYFYKLIKNKN